MDIRFSFHAYKRVRERLSISHTQLAEIIIADLVVCIGVESNSNRSHKLFYSQKDGMCFVAVVDTEKSYVVTVLPVDYHNNIAWKVSYDAQQAAKQLTLNGHSNRLIQVDPATTNAEVFRITAKTTDGYGQQVKMVSLGSWPCMPYECSISRLIHDQKFYSELEGRLNDKVGRTEDGVYIDSILISLGGKGTPVQFLPSEIREQSCSAQIRN